MTHEEKQQAGSSRGNNKKASNNLVALALCDGASQQHRIVIFDSAKITHLIVFMLEKFEKEVDKYLKEK